MIKSQINYWLDEIKSVAYIHSLTKKHKDMSQWQRSKLKALLSVAFLFIASIASAFTIDYYNKDSQKYTMEVRSNGSTQKVEFSASTSSAASIQTSASEVEIKTSCGWVKVKNGAKVIIKDGCIKVQ